MVPHRTVLPQNSPDETTRLIDLSSSERSLSLSQDVYSIRIGDLGNVNSVDCTDTTKPSFQQSVRDLRMHLVKAHSRLSDLIQYHTGSIGMLGSMSIAVNSLTGPAMLNLPAAFSRAGLLPTVAVLVFVCILSALCSLNMASVISKVPGNCNFKKEVEYSQVFKSFWGPTWFNITQVTFLCCVSCLNISSIVDVSQVIDTFLGHWIPNGGTGALQITFDDKFHYSWIRWDYAGCSQDSLILGLCTPFRDMNGILITAGKILTIMIFFPLALMDLKENSTLQVVGFTILLATSVHFSIAFAAFPGKSMSNISLWGEDWSDLFGVVLFNFALVIAIPAWLYEREEHVDVPTVIHGSSLMVVVMYMSIGILGCIAMPNVTENMLQSMMSGSFGVVMQLSASLFAFGIVGLGIPLFSVLTRLNLTSSGLCSRNMGHILAVLLPFSVAFFMYDGSAVTKLLSWGGVVFTSLIAFIFPLWLSLNVAEKSDSVGSISVYCGYFETKREQVILLRVLFVLASIAVFCALIGTFISP